MDQGSAPTGLSGLSVWARKPAETVRCPPLLSIFIEFFLDVIIYPTTNRVWVNLHIFIESRFTLIISISIETFSHLLISFKIRLEN